MLLALLLCCLATLLLYIKFNKYARCFQTIPAPPNIFILGNALDITSSKVFLKKFLEYMEKCGDTCKVYIGPIPNMILTKEYKLVEKVLNSPDLLKKSFQYSFLENWLGADGLLISSGDIHWKKHKKIITSAFHAKILESFIPTIEKACNVLNKQLEVEVDKACTNISPFISPLSLDIICETTMGSHVNAQENVNSNYLKNLKIVLNIIIKRTFNPLYLMSLTYRFTKLYTEEKKAVQVLRSYTNSIITEKKKKFQLNEYEKKADVNSNIEQKERLAFLDLLVKLRLNECLSDEDIRQEVDTFTFAGNDTTAAALKFCLYSLAQHQKVQQNVVDEINDCFSNNAEENFLTARSLQNFKYLDAVIRESLRLYPPIPMIGRQLTKDIKFGDVTIPKDTNLIIFIYALHRDPTLYDRPEEFLPERFLNGDLTKRLPYQYIPFSAGSRNCVGQKFALLMLKVCLITILKRYKLLPVENQKIELISEVVLTTKEALYLKLQNREN